MTFYSIMESISHLGKMARTSAKSENPILKNHLVFKSKNGFAEVLIVMCTFNFLKKTFRLWALLNHSVSLPLILIL